MVWCSFGMGGGVFILIIFPLIKISLIKCNVIVFMSFRLLQFAVLISKVTLPLAKNTFCGWPSQISSFCAVSTTVTGALKIRINVNAECLKYDVWR